MGLAVAVAGRRTSGALDVVDGTAGVGLLVGKTSKDNPLIFFVSCRVLLRLLQLRVVHLALPLCVD